MLAQFQKRTISKVVACTNDESTTEYFSPGNSARIVNNSGGSVTVSVFEKLEDGTIVDCEDISDLTIADGSSKSLPIDLILPCHRIGLKLSSGTASLTALSADFA